MAPSKQSKRSNGQRKQKNASVEVKQKTSKARNDQIEVFSKVSSDNGKSSDRRKSGKRIEKSLWNNNFVILLLAVASGALNSYHQYTLFENDRHFSHLSTLEREMTFRTEMGLYYSYFKTIVESSTLEEGFQNIMYNNLTEFPNVINTLKRFNLYPEIILGASYRLFMQFAQNMHFSTKQCWTVSRGDDLPPIESCEGLGEPAYFYIMAVFTWNGLVSTFLFLYGRFLSNSVVGGVLATVCFFYNHGESTRVQWTPPLRESFAYPILLGQMLIISQMIRENRRNYKYVVVVTTLTTASMLSWQFSQFVLLTQNLAVFGTYMMGFISADTLQTIILCHLFSLGSSFLLLFGNEMLVTSLFATTLIVAFILTLLDKHLKKLRFLPVIWTVQLFLLAAGSLALKTAISTLLNIKHDAHIWNILKSKFTSYKDFHTLLYTCAAEFNFMEKETPLALTKTLLLPSAVVAILIALFQIARRIFRRHRAHASEGGEVMYNIVQLGAFTIMAILIMRLKLLFTPHLCLLTSLLASKEYMNFLPSQGCHGSLIALLIGMMSVQGVQNIQSQRNILGEYSNPELEHLLQWVSDNTSPDAVFAGPMPTMANLMLSTRRPIVNHPHYEDADLRERTKQVYTLYSRKSGKEVHGILSSMGVDYAVLEHQWCFRKAREGCGMAQLWDVEDPINRGKESLCERLYKNPQPFAYAFRNSAYTILKVK